MPKKVYPKLPDLPGVDDAALDSFDEYLTGVIAQAAQGVRNMQGRSAVFDEGWVKENARYWKNGKAILTWLRGQIRRQRKVRREREEKRRGDSP